jgi:hypothetical protein
MNQQGIMSGQPDERIDYEPPRVERVLTPSELEREVLYAGSTVDFVSLTDRP